MSGQTAMLPFFPWCFIVASKLHSFNLSSPIAKRLAIGEDKLAWTIEIAFSLAFPSTINSSAVRLAKTTYQSYFFVQKIGRGRKLFACPNHRQLYPHLINSCIPWNPVEDGFIYSIKPKTFFLLLVGIDYKTFDGQGSLFIKTQE